MKEYKFRKMEKTDSIWWVYDTGQMGDPLFSFDKKNIIYLFQDYPHNLTKEQVEIFDKENPFWAEFFGRRKK